MSGNSDKMFIGTVIRWFGDDGETFLPRTTMIPSTRRDLAAFAGIRIPRSQSTYMYIPYNQSS